MSPAKKAPARKGTTRGSSAKFAELDDPLFPPHLDLLRLPEALGEEGGEGPDYSMILESICGVTDDSQDVESYDGTLGVTQAFVNAHDNAVAQVQWNDDLASVFTNPGNVNGVRWGSGTMIGPDLFLTCGHLFDAGINGWNTPRQNGTNNAISPQQTATSMHLNFQYQRDASGNLRAEQRFAITQLVEYRLGGLDMAICRVAGNPGNTYGWAEVSTVNAAVGDMLAIIGHPAGQPKRIEAGPATSISGSVIGYNDIDTLGGNSGSGILQASTGRLVGVHTNGGCNPQGTGSNTGVAIAAIRAVSPTLQALASGSATADAEDRFTALARDVLNTTRASDVLTISARDHVTALARDVLNTLRATDTLGTTLARDAGSRLAADVATVAGGDDPTFTRVETIVNPGDIIVDPPYLSGGLRPFVQVRPSAVEELPDGEGTLAEELSSLLHVAIQVQTEVLESLHELTAALVEQ